MNAIKHIGIVSVCFLSACATTQLTTDPSAHVTQNPLIKPTENATQPMNQPVEAALKKKTSAEASTVSSWELSGAMAARNKNKSWTASINWVQQGINRYQIRLFGPLGGGTIIVEKNGGVVTYADGPKKSSSNNADKLLEQHTGVRLPVQALYYWVRGLPAPGSVQSATYDEAHHMTTLSQAGYTIRYSNYTSVSNTVLPGKISLQGHGVTIKLVIKHWRV